MRKRDREREKRAKCVRNRWLDALKFSFCLYHLQFVRIYSVDRILYTHTYITSNKHTTKQTHSYDHLHHLTMSNDDVIFTDI